MMNRLWVRQSLVIIGGIVLIIILVVAAISFMKPERPFEASPELAAEYEVVQQQQLETFGYTVTAVLIIGGVTAIVIGVLFSRTLTLPLDRLRDAAQAIEKQDFQTRVPEEGTVELSALASSFNNMAAQLESAETLRRNLLSDVAHELRHPLHVVKGNIEAMQDGVFPMDEEGLERLLNQNELLIRLVEDLHDLAQAEANQLVLHERPISIAKLVDEVVKSYQPLAAAKEIKLDLELLGKLPELTVDPERIRQVILNLLDNAMRYTPQGGSILVTVEQVDDQVEIRIKDSGVGIDADDLPFVFDRLYRTDKARNREQGGTGLGLAIVRALVETHGGLVTAVSDGAGKGSQFIISLPV